MSKITVLAVASEIYPLIKTGGLADVVGALAGALAAEDVAVVTLVPGYPAVTSKIDSAEPVLMAPNLFGGDARVLRAKAAGLDLFVLEAPHLFARPGNPYTGPDGGDWPDNPFRFAALCQIAARLALGECPRFRPDVVHAHDWQAGLTAAYLAYDRPAAPGNRDHDPQPCLPRTISGRASGAAGTAAACLRDRWRGILRHDRLLESGALSLRSDHHRVAFLCR